MWITLAQKIAASGGGGVVSPPRPSGRRTPTRAAGRRVGSPARPRHGRTPPREGDRVLAGAAADLQHVTLHRREIGGECFADRGVIAMKRGRVEPPVRRRRIGGAAESDGELRDARHTSSGLST